MTHKTKRFGSRRTGTNARDRALAVGAGILHEAQHASGEGQAVLGTPLPDSVVVGPEVTPRGD